ncbi:hypothetical protein BDV11DRAFT_186351 [Aspergillus similis]
MATLCIDRDHLNNKRLAVLDDALTHGAGPEPVQTANEGFYLPDGSFMSQSDVVAAMNFILSLEAPCLDHVRTALSTPSAQTETGHGHALTLSASVFRLYGDTPLPPDEDELLHVSKQTLQRLLELSVQITTAEELTPTQVWALLHQSPAFADSEARPGRIVDVAQELARYMKCHGGYSERSGYEGCFPGFPYTGVMAGVTCTKLSHFLRGSGRLIT